MGSYLFSNTYYLNAFDAINVSYVMPLLLNSHYNKSNNYALKGVTFCINLESNGINNYSTEIVSSLTYESL